MANVKVLIEVSATPEDAFAMHRASSASESEAERQTKDLFDSHKLAGIGIELDDEAVPVPMFFGARKPPAALIEAFAKFAAPATNPDRGANSAVIPAEVPAANLEQVRKKRGVTLWPNSELTLFDDEVFDLAGSRGGVDCKPFRPAATVAAIRQLLGVHGVWSDGYRGQNVIVGIIDAGVDGDTYPVVGGFARHNAGLRPGAAPVSSHGSMCAADVLVAAPAARFYDYPFLHEPRSSSALQMFQAILDQRRVDGTPHLTNNSYGWPGVPNKASQPDHEVHDINHPIHRKVREVIAAGVATFFAAGNCGANCPSGSCHPSGIGPGKSIHGANSLEEVITVAAVNSRHERIGYSSQGPGMFHPDKPDIASYTHLFGNFGPGRPGGDTEEPFDSGTSAAAPVAAGVGALLLSAFPSITPTALKAVLMETAFSLGDALGFDTEHGRGVINAAAAYTHMRNGAAVA